MAELQASLRARAEELFRTLQREITLALEVLDGSGTKFFRETWERPGGGGGITQVFKDGDVFEKAGVNFSAVHGEAPDSMKPGASAMQFFATGVSLVLHPRSPKIPTVHANFRYFEQSDGASWFGGGSDLTPYYLDVEDAVHFHHTLKTACDKHDLTYYPRFKAWCDEYFWIKHRNESRGIGGIFFDHLSAPNPREREQLFSFVEDAGRAFLPAYVPIVERHKDEVYAEAEKHWQLLRRGRYVEFNLVYDRGTRFGLETNGRTESILMSLPAVARWEYDVHPTPGTPEAALEEVLRHPREWAKL
ncbi:MAG: oxygen-dependent coproporphyrinogen oxidase [Bacteroidota bacterium]|nr:oxygen-dependent coproporphyrinogen oxidase [Bacteroidota bacterium]MDP4233740.1 oxygen-dependent coproporphyrinogen oxidase [Bacteroidota bacterium]MDP4242379.1 oxygen-dependent coproporphyrinogen oxidase [Bacteroidota bacterium]MDP4287501.1 oxygen-dependent coproporphyrinogen oxidase [Bacteroidota bacterium]